MKEDIEFIKWLIGHADGFEIQIIDGDQGLIFKQELSCNIEEFDICHNEGIRSLLLQKAIDGVNEHSEDHQIVQYFNKIVVEFDGGYFECNLFEKTMDKLKESALKYIYEQERNNNEK